MKTALAISAWSTAGSIHIYYIQLVVNVDVAGEGIPSPYNARAACLLRSDQCNRPVRTLWGGKMQHIQDET